jgi:hypothetical protein
VPTVETATTRETFWQRLVELGATMKTTFTNEALRQKLVELKTAIEISRKLHPDHLQKFSQS